MAKKKDENELAKSIVDDIIEETESNYFIETERKAIARTGGKARAAKLTDTERSAIAKKAAQSRWKKKI
jgi:DNA-binding phage protein